MVFTRFQNLKSHQIERTKMDELSDFDSNDVNLSSTRVVEIAKLTTEPCRNKEKRIPIKQQFFDINRQMRELTSLVKTLTEMISPNNREESEPNVRRTRTPSHSYTQRPQRSSASS